MLKMLKMVGRPSQPENPYFMQDVVVITHPLGLLFFAHIYGTYNFFTY
jgi:hypothetical protein